MRTQLRMNTIKLGGMLKKSQAGPNQPNLKGLTRKDTRRLLYLLYRREPDSLGMPEDLAQHGIYFDLREALSEVRKVNERSGTTSNFYVWTAKEGNHVIPDYLLKIGGEFSLISFPISSIIKRRDPLESYKEFDYEYND